jgi:hypothetical protein
VREVLDRSRPGRLRYVVQLHLSRDCNDPDLAVRSARAILDGADIAIQLHTAAQDVPGPMISLEALSEETEFSLVATSIGSAEEPRQTWLPGWEA